MKVAWFDAEKWHEEEVDSNHEIDFFISSLSIDKINDSYDALVVCPASEVTEEVMRKIMPEKVVCRSSGYDHVDIEAAESLGIRVQNTPGYGKHSVAEYNMSLILAASRNICGDSGLNPNKDEGSQGLELRGKTLGVIGAGRIGRELLKRAKAFDMELLAYDPYEDQEAADKIGYRYVELEKLLERSDIISVNCPLTESTRELISDQEFEVMNEAVFVNVARGDIVDTSALKEALEEGNVIKAALDVVEDEKFDLLSNRDDVLTTPHNAYNTREAVVRRLEIALDNLDSEKNTVNGV